MKNPAKQKEQLAERTLRIPQDLADEIQAAADSHGISVNKEITDRLRTSTVSDQLFKLTQEVSELRALIREVLSLVG